jgi:NAD+ kinase
VSARGAPIGSGVPISIEEAVPVKRVLLLTHREPAVTATTLPAVLSILKDAGVQVLVPAGEVVKHRILAPFSSADGMQMRPGGEDLILVLGGDGSILRALAREAGSGAPVIGVNYGRVGFLASIERETLERDLARALAGEYVVLGLPSLKAEWADGDVEAVNDLAIFRGGESRIADLTYAVDGEVVATVRCDGVVMSTPVGSTAYNLAAGGPTVSWRVRCFVLSFIALHHLDSRPLVIGAEETLTVTNSALVGDCELQADGQRIGALGPGRSVRVGLGGAEVHLATFPEASFFRRYREKFGRP